MAAIELNTNSLGVVTPSVVLGTNRLITLYVFSKTGASNNHRVGIEVSPDGGTSWILLSCSVLGEECETYIDIVATHVRAKVVEVEGGTSTVDVHILVG